MDAKVLVERMGIEEVKAWAGLLNIKQDPIQEDDAIYLGREISLRTTLAEAMEDALKAASASGLPADAQKMIGGLVREEFILMIGDSDVQVDVLESVREQFFACNKSEANDEYSELVDRCCNSLFDEFHQVLLRVLRDDSRIIAFVETAMLIWPLKKRKGTETKNE